MMSNLYFIIILIIIFVLVYLDNLNENFINSKYKIIIVNHKNFYLIHIKNHQTINKIYKIYKNKFIIL